MARFACLLIVLIAGCAQLGEKPCPVCPPPKPAPERAQYIASSFAALAGGQNASLEPSLRAFVAGCPRAGGTLLNACASATAVEPGHDAAARRFLESYFVPYALASPEPGDTGIVTR